MASELQSDYLTGKNVYFQLRNNVGQIWNGTSFVAYATADIATYNINATEQGTASGYYAASMPAANSGIYYVVAKERAGGGVAETDITVGTGVIQWDGAVPDATGYQAKVWMTDDDAGTSDRYTVVWFRNGQPITSSITVPTIEVIKAADGTDLIASTAMTQIGTTGTYRYTATGASRIVNGVSYIILVQATIQGATRSWYQGLSRDSA